MLCGMDQVPESRSMVFSEAWPGDFSAGAAVLVILAVKVDMEGRVWEEETVGVCGPVVAASHGRWVTALSMTTDPRW